MMSTLTCRLTSKPCPLHLGEGRGRDNLRTQRSLCLSPWPWGSLASTPPPALPRSVSSGWAWGAYPVNQGHQAWVSLRRPGHLFHTPPPQAGRLFGLSHHHWMSPSNGAWFISAVPLEEHCVTNWIKLLCVHPPSSQHHCYQKSCFLFPCSLHPQGPSGRPVHSSALGPGRGGGRGNHKPPSIFVSTG